MKEKCGGMLHSDLHPAVDRGWSWVVLACSFTLQAISVGLAFSVGVYYVEWIDTFGDNRGSLAWIGGINIGLLFACGPAASVLSNRFSHRCVVLSGAFISCIGLIASSFASKVYVLYFTYGLVAGVGFCFMYLPSVVIVGLYFHRKRSFAMAFSVIGVGVGSLVLPPVLRQFVIAYTWRGSLFLSSGICLQACVLGSFLRPPKFWTKEKPIVKTIYKNPDLENNIPKEKTDKIKPKEKKKIFNFTLFKEPAFILLWFNLILWNIGSVALISQVTDYAEELGTERTEAVFLVSMIGLCSACGRLLIALVSQFKDGYHFAIYTLSTFSSGVAICFFPSQSTYFGLMAFAVMYGLSFGVQLGIIGAMTADLFGVARLTSAYGYLVCGDGIGGLIGPPLTGWLRDLTGDYQASFYTGGGLTIFAAFILLVIPLIKVCRAGSPTKKISSDIEKDSKEQADLLHSKS